MAGRTPPKPWERTVPSSGVSPADGLPKPWDRPAGVPGQVVTPAAATTSALAAVTGGGSSIVAQAPRPWERQGVAVAGPASTSYGGAYGGGYGTPVYNRPYGTMYNSSMYGGFGNSMYGGYGGMFNRPGMYGSTYGPGYGGGMYNNSMYGGGPSYGIPGPGLGPYDPNHPNAPPQPPSAWQAMLHAISGVVHFFGRLSFLVDENAHAVHFFISALLQLLDRFGSLYGELARFVLRLLGFKPRDKSGGIATPSQQTSNNMPTAKPHGLPGLPNAIPSATLGGGQWDSLWSK